MANCEESYFIYIYILTLLKLPKISFINLKRVTKYRYRIWPQFPLSRYFFGDYNAGNKAGKCGLLWYSTVSTFLDVTLRSKPILLFI